MESHSGKAPIFSFQFHPEAVPYLWGDRADGALMKDKDSPKINHALSEFVGELFRGQQHRFASNEQLVGELIRNYGRKCNFASSLPLLAGLCSYDILLGRQAHYVLSSWWDSSRVNQVTSL
ncbi:hypothetical protein FOZ62_021987 [Perkinsus olseni]|uniref:Gamma-glutamyl hydrolase n=1 Tax=Perkinsus olseni TaxID=32597 RepID=A0A7J6TME3_PEROL|nr:hypothetical protein FOZ62_021987 [Perkinsus olseni]